MDLLAVLDAHHAADGLDDDLGNDGHQDKGHGVGGGVADHGSLGVRFAGGCFRLFFFAKPKKPLRFDFCGCSCALLAAMTGTRSAILWFKLSCSSNTSTMP